MYMSSTADTGIGLPPLAWRTSAGSCGAPANTSAEPAPTAVLRGGAPAALLRRTSASLGGGASTEDGAEACREPNGPDCIVRRGATSSGLCRGLFASCGPASSSGSTAGPRAELSSSEGGPGGLGTTGAAAWGPGTTSSALAVPGGTEGRLFVVVACVCPANSTAGSLAS